MPNTQDNFLIPCCHPGIQASALGEQMKRFNCARLVC